MPISLICGACEAKLTAPDAAAGKKVKCRQCGVILEIPIPEPQAEPDFEFVEDEPAPKPATPKPAPPKPAAKAPPPAAAPLAKAKPKPVMMELADDEDEDDRPVPKKKSKPVVVDEDEDDRPVKPKKKPVMVVEDEDDEDPKPKKPGKKAAVIVVEDDEDEEESPKKAKKAASKLPFLIGGSVLGLALVGFLVYWFALREPDVAKNNPAPNPNPTPNNPNGPGPVGPGLQIPAPPKTPPAGWVEFAGEGFSAHVPQGVQLVRNAQVERMLAAEAPGAKVWMNSTPPVVFQVAISKASSVVAAQFARDPDAALMRAAKDNQLGLTLGTKVEKEVAVVVVGRKWRQFLLRLPNQADSLMRITIHDGSLVTVNVMAQNLTSETDDRVKPFFEGFAFAEGANPQPNPPTGGPNPDATDLSKYGLPVVMNLPAGAKVEREGEDEFLCIKIETAQSGTILIEQNLDMAGWKRRLDIGWKGYKTIAEDGENHFFLSPRDIGTPGTNEFGIYKKLTTGKGLLLGVRFHSNPITRQQADVIRASIQSARAK